MNRRQAITRLAKAGFEIDWTVTGRHEDGYSGTIDPIGRMSINGDCRGCVILAETAAQFYDRAVTEAESLTGNLSLCTQRPCDHHDEVDE